MIESEDIHRLTYEEKEITLIGTAHVSRESAELVERVIADERPETVCVELCQSRYQAITQQNRWQNMDLFKVIKEKKAFLLLSNLLLAYFQRRIGQKLGIRPGEEMLRSIAAAEEVGARIHLADRDVRVTLSRVWRLMGFWTKVKLMAQFFASVGDVDSINQEDIERMKKQDALEAVLEEVGESFPEIRRTLIDERDQYLAHKIRNAPGQRIVAVVGAGHVPGIRKNWEQPVDIEALEQVPPKGKLAEALKLVIPVFIVGSIVVGFFYAGTNIGTDMLKWWIIANAGLAGLGAALAFAHPLTILSAIIAAPFATIHPLIAVGWVSGLVEAFLGKPKVMDFEKLLDDITSLKGFWRNRITRILLVVVFTNLGATIGNLVAIPMMVKAFT